MSRGLGKTQRRILETLANWGCSYGDGWHSLRGIKAKCWGRRGGHLDYWKDHEQNHHYSFRRALDSLAKRGLLECRFEGRDWRKTAYREYRLTEEGLSVHSRLCTLTEGTTTALDTERR